MRGIKSIYCARAKEIPSLKLKPWIHHLPLKTASVFVKTVKNGNTHKTTAMTRAAPKGGMREIFNFLMTIQPNNAQTDAIELLSRGGIKGKSKTSFTGRNMCPAMMVQKAACSGCSLLNIMIVITGHIIRTMCARMFGIEIPFNCQRRHYST